MIKAIVFDLDNTLIDFMTMKEMAVSGAVRAMQDAGLDVSTKRAEKLMFRLYRKYGIEYHTVFQKFLKETFGRLDYRILANAIVGYRKAEQSFMRPYPKVKHTLTKLKERGITLAILTDAPRMRAWMRLAELDITDFFDQVLTYDDTKAKKPKKKPFILMLKKLRRKPSEVMMVGDSLTRDIKGAKAVGMKTCYAKYGETQKSSARVRPDFVIRRIDRLLAVVQSA